MEVHAHTHTPRKRWTHYFWEFLMLFLAVFCGFLAEYKLEHTIEHQREKKYISTLVEDLKADTAYLSEIGDFIEQCLSRYDTVSSKLKPPILKENLEIYYKECYEIYNFYAFVYNDRTIEQLRNSGNFRLIRKREVSDRLVYYDGAVRNGFSFNYKVLWDQRLKLLSLQNHIIDKDLLQYYDLDKGVFARDSLYTPKLLPFKLLTNDNNILYHYYNEWKDNILFLDDFLDWIKALNNRATALLTLINKEYHLN